MRIVFFGSVSVSTAFRLVPFGGRVWKEWDTAPADFIFPVVTPILLFTFAFVSRTNMLLDFPCAERLFQEKTGSRVERYHKTYILETPSIGGARKRNEAISRSFETRYGYSLLFKRTASDER